MNAKTIAIHYDLTQTRMHFIVPEVQQIGNFRHSIRITLWVLNHFVRKKMDFSQGNYSIQIKEIATVIAS